MSARPFVMNPMPPGLKNPPNSPSPEACREYTAMLKDHQQLIQIAEQMRRVAAGIEVTRQKLEGLLFRATVGRGLTEQMSGELLQLRVQAQAAARALEQEVEGAAQLREAAGTVSNAGGVDATRRTATDAVGALERSSLRTD